MRWCDSGAYSGRQPPMAQFRVRNKQTSIKKSSYPDYLMHYGIFGQKWGVRRYQNEDGTLTEEGKQHYSKTPESEKWKKSDAEHLSDEELNRRNSRLQREKQYKDLTTSEVEREKKQFKKDLIKKLLVVPVLGVAAILGKHYITKNADKIPHLISKVKDISVSKIKTGGLFKGILSSSSRKYSGSNIVRNTGKEFNYRPRFENSLPLKYVFPITRDWPKTW